MGRRETRRPAISVLMPVYNAAPYLAEAIESVLGQSFEDFEFLIHDDGSTDGSWAILKDYARRDPRIRISQADNAGIARVLNRMSEQARGAYLARMDADDICVPERFARQLEVLEAAPELALVSSDCLVIDEAGRPIHYVEVPLSHKEIDNLHMRGHCAIRHPTVMMRRTALMQAGGYDPAIRYAEDLDLWLRMAEHGELSNLPEVLLQYRIHDGSVSSTHRDTQTRETREICQAACTRRGASVPFESGDWRMTDTPASRRKFYLRFAWQGWKYGFRDTWRHYALKSVQLAPFSLAAWKVLILGAIRRPKKGLPCRTSLSLSPPGTWQPQSRKPYARS